MRRVFVASVLALSAASLAGCVDAPASGPQSGTPPEPPVIQQKDATMPKPEPEMAQPRPGDYAVREEFDAARKAGTAEAWDLFIARNADHPLAEEARRIRASVQ
jgi:hypothetical protein